MRLIKYLKNKIVSTIKPYYEFSPNWIRMQELINKSDSVIDLGCGNSPHPKAKVGVDYYIKPEQRLEGRGASINVIELEKKGIKFLNQRIDSQLPFNDKEFDFAYSHHVFEHLENPALACEEMMRIAKAGAIITPSIFAENIFGRKYHLWLVKDFRDTIFFFKKQEHEDRPFGNHPNAFDKILNEGNWHSNKKYEVEGLSNILRNYYFSRSQIIDVIFIWENKFKYFVFE